MRFRILPAGWIILLLVGCSPKIGTALTETVPNMSKDELAKMLLETNTDPFQADPLSKMDIFAGGGYGWRMAKLNPNFTNDEKEYYKGIMNGRILNASFTYYLNDYYGVGLVYSAYNTQQNKPVYFEEYGQGSLLTKDMITFLGPSFMTRYAFTGKWIANGSLSFGYLGYISKQTFPNLSEKRTGATAGLSSTVGIDYKINRYLGIGLNCTAISGLLNSITEEKNGHKTIIKANSAEEKEGLGQLQIYLGIRYYLK